MIKELEKAGIQLFEKDVTKWNAFIDLIELKGKVQNHWIRQLREKMKEVFVDDDNWRVEFGGAWDARWHLKSESAHRVNFWLCEHGIFHFVIHNPGGDTAEKIKELFVSDKYKAIRNVWGPNVQTNYNHEIKLRMEGKWSFGSLYDDHFNFERLVWYAGNDTDKFISQIQKRVAAFKNPPITALLHQLVQDISARLVANNA